METWKLAAVLIDHVLQPYFWVQWEKLVLILQKWLSLVFVQVRNVMGDIHKKTRVSFNIVDLADFRQGISEPWVSSKTSMYGKPMYKVAHNVTMVSHKASVDSGFTKWAAWNYVASSTRFMIGAPFI